MNEVPHFINRMVQPYQRLNFQLLVVSLSNVCQVHATFRLCTDFNFIKLQQQFALLLDLFLSKAQ